MKWALLFIAVTACSSGDEPPAAPPPRPASYQPAAPALPVAELRGRRLCQEVWPPSEIARVARQSEVSIASGWPRADTGQLRCVYRWPGQGPAAGSAELGVDCRDLRPTLPDLEDHWRDESIEKTPRGLLRKPASGVVQVHLGLDHPPCYVSVTAGALAEDVALSLAEVARARLGPQIALALSSYPTSAAATESQ